MSNLQRQVIHATADIGGPKVESAATAIRRLNPHVAVAPHPQRLIAANALEFIARYDIVADGSDNFATRYLVSDACFLAKKVLVERYESELLQRPRVLGIQGGRLLKICSRLSPLPLPPLDRTNSQVRFRFVRQSPLRNLEFS